MSGQASKPKDEECAVSTSQVPQCVTQHQCVQCKLSSSEQGRTSESRADSPEPAGGSDHGILRHCVTLMAASLSQPDTSLRSEKYIIGNRGGSFKNTI
eukprot:1151540-Pelagomonas_calceolata.AAC.2